MTITKKKTMVHFQKALITAIINHTKISIFSLETIAHFRTKFGCIIYNIFLIIIKEKRKKYVKTKMHYIVHKIRMAT